MIFASASGVLRTLVSIFDAQTELSAVSVGKAPIKKRHISGAHMGIARRRRRYAGSDRHRVYRH